MNLVVTPEADADSLEAARWYHGKNPGTGDQFLDDVKRCYGIILRQPTSFPRVRPPRVRGEFRA